MAAFGRLLDVVDCLREKCPWDHKQTNQSLRTGTIEEVYELADALLDEDTPNIKKELGDVLLHVCFYALICREQGQFDIADVCDTLVDKLVYRHPHVYHPSQVGAKNPRPLPYGADKADEAKDGITVGEVLNNWEQIKLKEKGGNRSTLAGVPKSLPALIKAYRIQDKARHVGFDWEDKQDVWAKVAEELGEFKAEIANKDKDKATREFGDFLFSIINAGRLYGINPDDALSLTNEKFIRRFNYIEEHSIRQGKPLTEMTLAEMDALWEEAKKEEKQ